MKYILKAISIAFLSVLLTACASTKVEQPEKETKEEQQEIYIPKNLEECFVELNRLFEEETKKQLRTGELEPIDFHFSAGIWMRNNWGFWGGSHLAEYFNELGIYHPDDMSGIILDSYARHLKGEPIKLDEQIKHYQDYWEEMNASQKSNQSGDENSE